ncbi:glycosyltransferase family 4 protein [Candidatus Dependentiae bacterium]|nr:glycosyltransferase family 4 protein [Candidatus Dependentiae bacterium]
MKKILYIHHGKGLGGAPLSLLYLIKNLDKTKYEPVVLFLHDSQAVNMFKEHGINVVGVVGLNDFSHTKIYWYKWYHAKYFLRSLLDSFKTYFFVADKWLKQVKPDIVHLNTSTLFIWGKVAKKLNIPVITHIREPLSEGYLGIRRAFIKNRVSKYSDFIAPISQNDALPWKNNPKTRIVYNAVDITKFDKNLNLQDFFKKYNLNNFDPKILFLGGLSQEKGTLTVFKIFEQILKLIPDAKLIVAGYFEPNFNGNYFKKIISTNQRYAKQVLKILERVKDSVIFTGSIDSPENLLAMCDVLLNPFTVGHFSRPIIEAGFMEKPVLASKLAPLDELVIHGTTGYLIDPNNIGLWVEKLYAVLTNKKLNEQLSKNAYEFCNKNFNIFDQIKKIENLYDSCLLL